MPETRVTDRGSEIDEGDQAVQLHQLDKVEPCMRLCLRFAVDVARFNWAT